MPEGGVTVLVSAADLEARRAVIGASPDLGAIAAHLRSDLDRVLAAPLYVPERKALLSRWGAQCRDDGAALSFDPFSPERQSCTHCGRHWETEQSHRWWVYWYQLWLAERVLVMSLHAGDGGPAERRAVETLALLVERYQGYPNADNVLGPSRPFFSTYLESVWVLQLASAAALLEGLGRLPADLSRDLGNRLFRPSAAIIADFPEGRSNRQVWNATALYALGRVLGDEAMAREAAHGEAGILASLSRNVAADGLWYEGENYHWFALRGLAWGAQLLRAAGEVDLWQGGGQAGERFRAAFRAPVRTVLPDFTFPARRDSKFGVSLRQRRMAELWEWRLAGLLEAGGGNVADDEAEFLASLLSHVYDPAVPARDESWREITDVEREEASAGVRRSALGWKGLLFAAPGLRAADPDAWRPGTEHLDATGLAIFRRDEGRTYVSLDYGESGGGHGHADRLHLTLVAAGVPWLLDFGTGSYVAPSLAWYRTTLAHNAPLVDGMSQAMAAGHGVAFDEADGYGWVCATLPDGTAYDGATLQRTVVLTPGYLLDVTQMGSEVGERQLALPWHALGRPEVDVHGITVTNTGGATLRIALGARQPFQVMVQKAPGPPGTDGDLPFGVVVATGEAVTLAACLDLGAGVDEVECVEDDFIVRLRDGRVHVHRATDEGWVIELDRGDPVMLGGLVPESDLPAPAPAAQGFQAPGGRFAVGNAGLVAPAAAEPPAAMCPRAERPPALDGTLDGFPPEPVLVLDDAAQFRRAESAWEGPGSFSARGWLCHDGAALYLAVEVVAPAPAFRHGEEPDPEWENENPDIHSDGLQLYVESTGFYGWLLVPGEGGSVRVAGARGTDGVPAMITKAAWAPTGRGYRVTAAVEVPDELSGEMGLDLMVNRLAGGCERRSAQLVWSGAKGARLYLAGDRALNLPLPRVGLA